MDDTSKAIIDRITVRYSVPTRIPSGDMCKVFFDCIKLSPSELARLAAEAIGDQPEGSFELVVGIAYTGILYAAAVAGGKEVAIYTTDSTLFGPSVAGKRIVIVDDVVHSGKRIREVHEALEKTGAKVVGYACIIDRSEGRIGRGSVPLWSAHQTSME